MRQDTGEIRHVASYAQPVVGVDGIVRVAGAALDVTDRVRAVEILAEKEARLARALDGAVAALSATVEMRDPYTAGHERRAAELACAIACRLGWGEEEIATLRTAAHIHDVGKVSVPAEILSKPGRLTDAEFALIKSHPVVASEILASIEFAGPVAEIVLQHHERLDGTGYPCGLKGEEILPAAHVVAVADVVEAMISHRPYRPALPLEEAIAEIRGGLGVRYDAGVSEACLALLEEGFRFSA